MRTPSRERDTDRELAIALLRFVLGVNITVHGVSRMLSGVSAFAHSLVPAFAKTPLPAALVYSYAWSLPFVETGLGLLLLLGLFRRPAYVLGLLLIASLTFGSALRQDWTAASEQLIYALLYAILLAARKYDVYCVDTLWKRRSA